MYICQQRAVACIFAAIIAMACPTLLPAAGWTTDSASMPTGRTDRKSSETMTAREILDGMGQTYASCTSYQDSGMAVTRFLAENPWTSKTPFSSAFVRPHQFRLEFERTTLPERSRSEGKGGDAERYIIHRESSETHVWWDAKPGIEKRESLKMALAEAQGVSAGIALRIPALLMPDEITCAWRLTELREPKRLPDAVLGKNKCFVVSGADYSSELTTLWIDQDSMLLLQEEDTQTTAHSRVNARIKITLEPRINEPVSSETLGLRAPGR